MPIHRQFNAPAAAALAALSVAAFSAWDGSKESQPPRRIVVAQEMTDEKMLKAQLKKAKAKATKAADFDDDKAAAKQGQGKAVDEDQDGVMDDGPGGKGKCPPGQRRAPTRGRGGDGFYCI